MAGFSGWPGQPSSQIAEQARFSWIFDFRRLFLSRGNLVQAVHVCEPHIDITEAVWPNFFHSLSWITAVRTRAFVLDCAPHTFPDFLSL